MARLSDDASSRSEQMTTEENLPFLDDNKRFEEAAVSKEQHHRSYRCCSYSLYWPFILLFQFIFIVIIIIAISQRFLSPQSSIAVSSGNLDLSYPDLLRPAVKYNVYTPTGDWWQQPLYTDLSLESGMAWQEIMNHEAFRISKEEIKQFNIPTMLWDGKELGSGGFSSVLGVFHNLHCLRHIKQELFRDHYFHGRTAEAAEARVSHTKHCLEVIRTSVMCNPDLTPLPLLWDLEHNESYVKPEVLHRCVDWESLVESTKHRRYEYEEIIPKDL